MCKLNGWAKDSEKYEITEDLFRSIWKSLQTEADADEDEAVTAEEWVKRLQFIKQIFSFYIVGVVTIQINKLEHPPF